MTSPNTRYVKEPNTWIPLIAAGASMLASAYVFLMVGGWLETGQWPDPDPVKTGRAWAAEQFAWSGSQTFAAVVVVVLLLALFYVAMLRSARKSQRESHIDARARYLGDGAEMSEKAVRKHAVEANLVAGETVGSKLAINVRTGKWLWTGYRESTTAIMGPGSGKSTALVVPDSIDHDGPLWVTSNRNDVVALIAHARESRGTVWVYDPQGVAGARPVFRWDPLRYIIGFDDDRDGAEVRAGAITKMFAEAGRPIDTKTDAFFEPAGQELLGNLMLAARLGGFEVTKCFEWLAKSMEEDEPTKLLWDNGYRLQSEAVASKYRIYDKTKGSIFETASGMIRFLANQSALPWVVRTGPDDDRPVFDPAAFVRSDGDTMICLSREGHASFGPIIAALTTAVIEAAEAYAKTCPGGRLPKPFKMNLDEVANVCRISILPDLYSHAGGRGISLTAILQSRAQGKGAWGEVGMDKLWGASTIKILGRGIADGAVLKEWSEKIGDQDVITYSRSRSSGRNGGSTSNNVSRTREPILPPSEIGSMPIWRCLVDSAGSKPVLAKLVPWWERGEEMRTAVEASKAHYEATSAVPLAVDPADVDDETGAAAA